MTDEEAHARAAQEAIRRAAASLEKLDAQTEALRAEVLRPDPEKAQEVVRRLSRPPAKKPHEDEPKR